MVLVLLPGGRFWMGADSGSRNPSPDTTPAHPVRLGEFFISKYELTQGQWVRLTQLENPSRYHPAV